MAAHSHVSDHKDIIFRIARQDRPGSGRYWQSFSVPYTPGMNVISALQYIAAHPTPLGSKESVTPIAWDCACLEEICGSCTMLINGKVMQSCSALVDNLNRTEAGEIELEPMSKYPVIRDLVVDRSRIFEGLKRVKAWIPVDGYYDAGPGPTQSIEDSELRYPLSKCMTCGCCMEACPQYTKVDPLQEYGESDADFEERRLATQNEAFMGAAVISQAILFNSHPTGTMNQGERLEALMGPGGITDCGNSQNCVKVCPKLIPLTWSIGKAGRDTTLHSIKRFFLR